MMKENRAKLLQAYRSAIEAGQHEIADMLEDVILDVMGSGEVKVPVMRGIKIGDGEPQVKPSWNVTCGPDIVPLSGTMEFTGIDHLSKEMTV